MKKNIFVLLCLFAGFGANTYAQTDAQYTINKIDKIKGNKISVDPYGNFYIIQDATLHKYDLSGKFLYSHTDFSLGNITSIDVSNPMKIMLFYREAGVLVFLDDRLSPITEVLDLYAKNYNTIALACYTTTNNIWLFDDVNFDLITLDFYLNPVTRTHNNFSNFAPTQLFEVQEKMIAIHNPATGVLFFDSFGTYSKVIGIQSDSDVQIVGSTIYYLKNNKINTYNYVRLEEQTYDLPVENVKQFLVYRNKIIALNTSGEVFLVTNNE